MAVSELTTAITNKVFFITAAVSVGASAADNNNLIPKGESWGLPDIAVLLSVIATAVVIVVKVLEGIERYKSIKILSKNE